MVNQEKDSHVTVRKIEDFFQRWLYRVIPEKETEELVYTPGPAKRNYFLLFLKVLPWISLLVFAVTVFYDPLEGIVLSLPWRKASVSLDGILRMLAVTGLVGYGTNYIAIKMLFHPRKKRPLLGQGLVPASKVKIAFRLGEAISREIINPALIARQIKERELIKKYISKFNYSLREIIQLKEFQEDLLHIIEDTIVMILRSKEFRENLSLLIRSVDFDNLKGIEGGLLKIYKFLSGTQDLHRKIEEILLTIDIKLHIHREKIQDMLQLLPDYMDKYEESIEDGILKMILFVMERINIKKVIIHNLLEFDEMRLEKLLLYSTSEQLQYIQYLGCLLGIFGGLFIWLPFESFVFFSFLGGAIFIVDELLYRRQEKKLPVSGQHDGKSKDTL